MKYCTRTSSCHHDIEIVVEDGIAPAIPALCPACEAAGVEISNEATFEDVDWRIARARELLVECTELLEAFIKVNHQ